MSFDPNPLYYKMCQIFSENYSPENKVEIYNEGSSRCFDGSTLVRTNKGLTEISKVKTGDLLLTYNETTLVNEYKPVLEPMKMANSKPGYRITLKNGNVIMATQDHKFYFEGNWISLKQLLHLRDEKINNNKRQVSN